MDPEDMMGDDFQKGVNQLKVVAEEKASAAPDMPITEVEVEAMPIFYIEGETKISEMSSDFFGERYGKIGAYLGADSQNMLEMPLAVYHEWDEENDRAVIAVAMACESDKAGEGEVKKGMSHGGKAVKCVYTGPYEEGDKPHNAIADYMEANNLEMAGPPWEVYASDPGTEPDSTKWVTHVYYPIL
jgi:effector-binding domain-containing protein